jgi:integrase
MRAWRMELPKRKDSTRRSNAQYIKIFEDEYGDMPIAAIEQTSSRTEFLGWRDSMSDRPRTADLAWSVLQKIMAFGVDIEKLKRNPCLNAGRLAESGTRREKIWGAAGGNAKLREAASATVSEALMMAIWTGQRQGDLLRLQWSSYDGTHIRLKQSKTGRRVTVMASDELKAMLDRLKAGNEARRMPV